MDDLPEENESDIRKRAAWLLLMLAVVAALFVTLLLTVFNNTGNNNSADVDDIQPTTPLSTTPLSSPSGSATPTGSTTSGTPSDSSSATGSPSTSGSGSTSGLPSGSASTGTGSCPTASTCALPTDIGNAAAAINAYRTQHGKAAIPAAWSADAAQCALANGSGCSGGWAETQLSQGDGAAAVKKIATRAKLDTDMKSIEVGWAYDPKGKTYYFAIIRRS